MTEILGKVKTGSHDIPRGADVSLRIGVPAAWLNEGRSIEIELPRNLTCVKCGGGGCSACQQSGAISVRGKTELPEMVRVVLPLPRLVDQAAQQRGIGQDLDAPPSSRRLGDKAPESARPIVIRIPECGGLPRAAEGEAVRGMLLLEVAVAAEASPNVRCLSDDDAVDSSQMLRAEVRTRRRVNVDSEPPPSSRVARVSIVPRPVNAATRQPAAQQADSLQAITPPARSDVAMGAPPAPAQTRSANIARHDASSITEGNAASSTTVAPLHWFALVVGVLVIGALLTLLVL